MMNRCLMTVLRQSRCERGYGIFFELVRFPGPPVRLAQDPDTVSIAIPVAALSYSQVDGGNLLSFVRRIHTVATV